MIGLTLRLMGFQAVTAVRAADGLEIIEREAPDLVVLDLGLPDMDGRDLYHRARLQGYMGPVIVCSANGALAAQLELGAEGAIAKPFDPQDLADLVKMLLEIE